MRRARGGDIAATRLNRDDDACDARRQATATRNETETVRSACVHSYLGMGRGRGRGCGALVVRPRAEPVDEARRVPAARDEEPVVLVLRRERGRRGGGGGRARLDGGRVEAPQQALVQQRAVRVGLGADEDERRAVLEAGAAEPLLQLLEAAVVLEVLHLRRRRRRAAAGRTGREVARGLEATVLVERAVRHEGGGTREVARER